MTKKNIFWRLEKKKKQKKNSKHSIRALKMDGICNRLQGDVDDGEISSLLKKPVKTDPKDLQRMIFWPVMCRLAMIECSLVQSIDLYNVGKDCDTISDLLSEYLM